MRLCDRIEIALLNHLVKTNKILIDSLFIPLQKIWFDCLYFLTSVLRVISLLSEHTFVTMATHSPVADPNTKKITQYGSSF